MGLFGMMEDSGKSYTQLKLTNTHTHTAVCSCNSEIHPESVTLLSADLVKDTVAQGIFSLENPPQLFIGPETVFPHF